MFDDLEGLREIFKDVRLHLGIGTVEQLGLANDGSILRVKIKLLPENRQVVAEMGFADVYDVTFPELKDLVVVGMIDGHPDDAFVIQILNTKEEPIPLKARTGNSVKYSRPGKKLYLGSDTKVLIGKIGTDPTEPLVLGTVLTTFLTNVLDAFLNAAQIGQSAFGPVFLDPGVRANLVSYKSTYLTTASTNIVSQVSYTERGP